jgi:hypothetical protein
MASERILTNDYPHTLGQSIKAATHVRRLGREPYPRGLRSIQRTQARQTNHPSNSDSKARK